MRYLITISSLLLAISFYQGADPPNHSTKTGDTREQSKKEIKSLTVVPPAKDADSPCTEISEKNKDHEQTSTNNSDQCFVHLMTYLNFASTAVVTIFTILIWRIYCAMLRSSKINERAWIVPVVGTIEPTNNPDEFQVKVELKNNGKTPAWITASGSNGKGAIAQQFLPAEPPYTEMNPFSEKGSLLSPTDFLIHGFSLTRERLEHVAAEKSQLFIFGYAKYRDAYGDPHFVRYCFEVKKSQDAHHPHPLELYVGGPDAYMGAD